MGGIGIAIARHIDQGRGGALRVDSVEGKASPFTQTIPITVAAMPPRVAATPQSAAATSRGSA